MAFLMKAKETHNGIAKTGFWAVTLNPWCRWKSCYNCLSSTIQSMLIYLGDVNLNLNLNFNLNLKSCIGKCC